MRLELPPHTRVAAVDSIRRYAEANLPEPLGELPATALLDFLLAEIGPAIYNQAVADAAARLQARAADLKGELYMHEFGYWTEGGVKRGRQR